jgi:hypothetical protein
MGCDWDGRATFKVCMMDSFAEPEIAPPIDIWKLNDKMI